MNTTLLWLLLVPVIGTCALYYVGRQHVLQPLMLFAAVLPGALLIGVSFAISYGAAVMDTEIWNGQVISKERKHGTYEEPYDCNCSTDSKGNRSCQTCYRTHYTVKWSCESTIGSFTIEHLDSTWRSVYSTPDPARWLAIKQGDPVAKQNTYTNYVQAVPNSLFAIDRTASQRFAGLLPPYPINVYDHYRIDRFVTPGFAFTDAASWNQDISLLLRDLGPKKQVNVIVVIVKTEDPTYTQALRTHWEGANKNDMVLVIGSSDGSTISWVDIISWTKNELFKIQLIDRVRELEQIKREAVLGVVTDQIAKNFERRRMREFEYLKGEIDPPEWLVIALLVVLSIGYSAGAWWIVYDAGNRASFNRRMNWPGPR